MIVFLVVGSLISSTWGSQLEVDPNGYITFCPCMGEGSKRCKFDASV